VSFDTIIANGKVVTANDKYLADIAINAGEIEAIGQNLPRHNAARVLGAAGKYVFPGGIDVHTHLDMPFGGTTSADDFETGTRAAAFGGTTTLIDFAIQYRSEEHTSELQSRLHLVCRLLLEKKKKQNTSSTCSIQQLMCRVSSTYRRAQ